MPKLAMPAAYISGRLCILQNWVSSFVKSIKYDFPKTSAFPPIELNPNPKADHAKAVKAYLKDNGKSMMWQYRVEEVKFKMRKGATLPT